MSVAGVAHPVERHLAKVEVASSSLVTRSNKEKAFVERQRLFLYNEINPFGHEGIDYRTEENELHRSFFFFVNYLMITIKI